MDIFDAIAHLTPAEREQFKDLIEECLDRQHQIRANRHRADLALTQMVDTTEQLLRDVAQLTDRAGLLYLKLAVPKGPVH